jgi:ketosteroid isomerase-like protein
MNPESVPGVQRPPSKGTDVNEESARRTTPDGDQGTTREIIDALYSAFLTGDAEGMLALLSDDISLRFLGQVDAHGIGEARGFFAFAAGLLTDVDFRIERKIVDGEWAAVIWSETARTAAGADWENHGVDVLRVKEGRVTELHENNDVRLVARHFPVFGPMTGGEAGAG